MTDTLTRHEMTVLMKLGTHSLELLVMKKKHGKELRIGGKIQIRKHTSGSKFEWVVIDKVQEDDSSMVVFASLY